MSGKLDNAEIEVLVRAYSADLYRFAWWLCRDSSLAEELVQETFTRAWRYGKSLRDEKAAKSWLFTILRNELARHYAHKRIQIDDQDLDDLVQPVESTIELEATMHEALEHLPLSYREPLLMQVLGGFSCREIAEIMALSEEAVMQRLSRARSLLRKSITSDNTARRVK